MTAEDGATRAVRVVMGKAGNVTMAQRVMLGNLYVGEILRLLCKLALLPSNTVILIVQSLFIVK